MKEQPDLDKMLTPMINVFQDTKFQYIPESSGER
ncbi:hypothetical protein A0O36_02757 [Piscirickettsiaceae bacterium NZ-RLO1]|nr:hypothetical protein A0O36_02757 [Piscirickettsiaceae bacterium NZ-RLO1]